MWNFDFNLKNKRTLHFHMQIRLLIVACTECFLQMIFCNQRMKWLNAYEKTHSTLHQSHLCTAMYVPLIPSTSYSITMCLLAYLHWIWFVHKIARRFRHLDQCIHLVYNAYENGAVANSLSQLHSYIKCGQKMSLTNAHTFVHLCSCSRAIKLCFWSHTLSSVIVFLVEWSYWLLFRYNGRLVRSHILNWSDRSNAWMHRFTSMLS